MGNFFASCFGKEKPNPETVTEYLDKMDDMIKCIEIKLKKIESDAIDEKLLATKLATQSLGRDIEKAKVHARIKHEKDILYKNWLKIYENQLRIRMQMENAADLKTVSKQYKQANDILEYSTKKLNHEDVTDLMDKIAENCDEIKDTTALLSAQFILEEPLDNFNEEEAVQKIIKEKDNDKIIEKKIYNKQLVGAL